MCDETDAGAQCATVADLFPVGTECFMMAIPHYGSTGKVCCFIALSFQLSVLYHLV